MFAYARSLLTGRPALWGPLLGCALLAAVPGALVATLLSAPLVALMLTGDLGLAGDLVPEPIGPLSLPVIASLGLAAALAGLVVWSRLYAVAVWVSDLSNEPDVRGAWSATRRSWWRVLTIYAQGYSAVGLVIGLLVTLTWLAGTSAEGLAGIALVGAALVLLLRTAVRVFMTVAIRAAVLEGTPAGRAWRAAQRIVLERRKDAAAVWMMLLAAGVSVWIGGRLISPVLQDTAFEYPARSRYTLGRELAQLVLGVPLEGLLLALSVGLWTAVYLGHVEPGRPGRTRPGAPRRSDPWLLRALGALAFLAFVSNGIPTLIDDAWTRKEEIRLARVSSREIQPMAAATAESNGPRTEPLTHYRVEARLDERRLEWSTTIDYLNDTGEELTDIGINVYPAAYERPVPQIPLARDLISIDFNGGFRARASSGELVVEEVTIGTRKAVIERDETALTVELPQPLEPESRVELRVDLRAVLPVFPERFGVWEDMTLLGNWIPSVAVRQDGRWRLDEFDEIGEPFFSEVADYTIELETPERIDVVGTGVLRSVVPTGSDDQLWRFEAPAVRDAAFAAGPFIRGLERSVGELKVRSWYPATLRDEGAANLDSAASAVQNFVSRFGPLPYTELDVVTTRSLFGGMEYPGVVFVSGGSSTFEGIPFIPDLLNHSGFEDAQLKYVVGHEAAHQWWYAAVGNDQARQPWLDEALAEVSTRTWLIDTEGDQTTWKLTNLVDEASPEEGVVSASTDDYGSNSAYTDDVYVAGSEVLMELRSSVGAGTFDEIMSRYYADHLLGIATVDDFIQTVSDVAGAEAAEVVSQYL